MQTSVLEKFKDAVVICPIGLPRLDPNNFPAGYKFSQEYYVLIGYNKTIVIQPPVDFYPAAHGSLPKGWVAKWARDFGVSLRKAEVYVNSTKVGTYESW